MMIPAMGTLPGGKERVGGARGRRGLPEGGLGSGWDGRRRRLHGSRQLAAALCRDSGTPAKGGGGCWVGRFRRSRGSSLGGSLGVRRAGERKERAAREREKLTRFDFEFSPKL